ncbi:peptidoglycan editing factor PgeF [Rhodohalobacter sp.]|uniref:peptidoglycan editing factor PgeF n=1 Tax=Rhodohalobacter sp. TaxID=1974210 RepID=UPI002ACD2AD9|nr:peptidoglycan editing factor PgeF [Rhodohalobacter sp.]MDZ7757347.1 peptidoglycan editing factor PgeF [Rhodohalobacter sp.]
MKLFYPSIFDKDSQITALFSESNKEIINTGGYVPGLNLGYNTEAEPAEVDKNFKLLFNKIGWNRTHLAIANQIHGSNIIQVTEPGVYDDTDGFITDKTGLSLGIRVADCVAILAGDSVNGIIGAFHAGWKGAADNIVPKGIRKMTQLGADPDHIRVYLSPCISFKNFEVGEEVASQFPDQFVDRESYKKPHVDLKGFIHRQLLNSGVNKENIELSEDCTVQDSKYYSYRRERDRAGRMLGLIKLNEQN